MSELDLIHKYLAYGKAQLEATEEFLSNCPDYSEKELKAIRSELKTVLEKIAILNAHVDNVPDKLAKSSFKQDLEELEEVAGGSYE